MKKITVTVIVVMDAVTGDISNKNRHLLPQSIVIKKLTFDIFNFHMLMKTITHWDMLQKMKKYN